MTDHPTSGSPPDAPASPTQPVAPAPTTAPPTTPTREPSYEWEGRLLYVNYRRRFDIRWDWADLDEADRQEWRDDARRKAERAASQDPSSA